MKYIVKNSPIIYKTIVLNKCNSHTFTTFTSFRDIGNKNYTDTMNSLGTKNLNTNLEPFYRSIFETDIPVFNLQVDIHKLKPYEYNSLLNYSKFLIDKEKNGEYLVPFGKTYIFGGLIFGFDCALLLFPCKWMYEYCFYSRRNPEKRQYIHKELVANKKLLVPNNEDTN